MKRKPLDKKLVLNKETITIIDENEFSEIKGKGTYVTVSCGYSCDENEGTCVLTNPWVICYC